MMVLSQPPVPALGLDTTVLHPLQCKIILVFLFWVDMYFFSHNLYFALLLLFIELTSASAVLLV